MKNSGVGRGTQNRIHRKDSLKSFWTSGVQTSGYIVPDPGPRMSRDLGRDVPGFRVLTWISEKLLASGDTKAEKKEKINRKVHLNFGIWYEFS